jgi:hypothetical protein
MTDKERRFWEACGFVYFHSNSGWVWVYPDGQTQNIHLPNINSLDDLIKYGWDKTVEKIVKDTGLQPHQAKQALVIRWMERWVGDKPPAAALFEALCLALEVEG